MSRLFDRFRSSAAPRPADDPAPGPLRGYALCGAPRSGSNYICEILSSTGALGRPREYFNGAARRIHDDPAYPDDPHAQIERILTMGATGNGIYGLKLFPGLFDTVAPHLKLTEGLPNLHFVRLRRLDVLGQAMSWVRSIQTRQFRSTETAASAPHYDGAAIQHYVGQVCQRNARWDMFFARTGIRPIELVYESVAGDPQSAADAIAAVLGLADRPRIEAGVVRLAVQRDAITDAWRERFHSEYGDRNYIDPATLLVEMK
ncbi:Trehalose 2-sulfotransferase [Methylobacterium cerastii]|uniref:Trehalose 2-sulfotransferase n=1 Tax=Methylobacterium cerastii TaxID=932741 RepID=A0ABQ4QHI3_9HYPH|nr:Stf0 family sulfotransferase [Methylobacterium cerastii]GJD44211.1 Trehalose 2-sulfotransferase [Methylobacterium cerastii]